jgi:hypothetical protein
MTKKTAEGLLRVHLRGGETVEVPNGKVEITYGKLGRAEKFHFINDGSPELDHLNTQQVISVTVSTLGNSVSSAQERATRLT